LRFHTASATSGLSKDAIRISLRQGALDARLAEPPVLHCSESDEIGNDYEHDPYCDKKNGVRNKIREDHEGQPANQWDDRFLFLAVQEESEPD